QPFFRVRFNAIAKNAFNANGVLPDGENFPDGSMVVKELYNTKNGNLALIAIMKKDGKHKNQGEGWLWVEYDPDGNEVYALNRNGSGCVGCHKTNSNDFVRLFKLYP